MKIILGVFDPSFRELKARFELESYNCDWNKVTVNEHYETQLDSMGYKMSGVISPVHYACLMAEEIFFDLTNIDFNLDDDSFFRYTINELLLVLTDISYFNKTRFFRNGEEISKDEVFNWFIFHEYWNQFLN